jgi:heme-degrading monooxygenase HmoA
MIVRVWRARATPERADDYPRHLTESVLPKLRDIPGFRGAYLLRRADGAGVEFVVLTRWASMEAVERFAGPTPEAAVVEPEARAAPASFDATVAHYQVLVAPDDVRPGPGGRGP